MTPNKYPLKPYTEMYQKSDSSKSEITNYKSKTKKYSRDIFDEEKAKFILKFKDWEINFNAIPSEFIINFDFKKIKDKYSYLLESNGIEILKSKIIENINSEIKEYYKEIEKDYSNEIEKKILSKSVFENLKLKEIEFFNHFRNFAVFYFEQGTPELPEIKIKEMINLAFNSENFKLEMGFNILDFFLGHSNFGNNNPNKQAYVIFSLKIGVIKSEKGDIKSKDEVIEKIKSETEENIQILISKINKSIIKQKSEKYNECLFSLTHLSEHNLFPPYIDEEEKRIYFSPVFNIYWTFEPTQLYRIISKFLQEKIDFIQDFIPAFVQNTYKNYYKNNSEYSFFFRKGNCPLKELKDLSLKDCPLKDCPLKEYSLKDCPLKEYSLNRSPRYFIPNEFTVQLKGNHPDFNSAEKVLDYDVICKQLTPGYYTLALPENLNLFDVLNLLNERENIEFAEPSEFDGPRINAPSHLFDNMAADPEEDERPLEKLLNSLHSPPSPLIGGGSDTLSPPVLGDLGGECNRLNTSQVVSEDEDEDEDDNPVLLKELDWKYKKKDCLITKSKVTNSWFETIFNSVRFNFYSYRLNVNFSAIKSYYSQVNWGAIKLGLQESWSYTQGSRNTTIVVIDSLVDFKYNDINFSFSFLKLLLSLIQHSSCHDHQKNSLLFFSILLNRAESQTEYTSRRTRHKTCEKFGIKDERNNLHHVTPHLAFLNSDISLFDFSKNSDSSKDCSGDHGTIVASICSGSALKPYDSEENIFAGVAPKCRLMSVGYNHETGVLANLVDSINFIVTEARNHQERNFVINCSLAIVAEHEALRFAFARAFNTDNIIIISAAGNEGNDLEKSPVYPACYKIKNGYAADMTLVVGGVNIAGVPRFSNFGEGIIDLCAPDDNIFGARKNNVFEPGLSGTSYAAPFVTGTAALVWSIFPKFSKEQVKQILVDSSLKIDLGSAKGGSGHIHASKAMKEAMEVHTRGRVFKKIFASMVIFRLFPLTSLLVALKRHVNYWKPTSKRDDSTPTKKCE